MGHDDMVSGYPISTGFCRLTGYQRNPRDRGACHRNEERGVTETKKESSLPPFISNSCSFLSSLFFPLFFLLCT